MDCEGGTGRDRSYLDPNMRLRDRFRLSDADRKDAGLCRREMEFFK